MIGPERITELRALLAKGSAGPWDTSVDARGTAVFGGGDMVTLCRHVAAGHQARANAELIAAMRNAIPELLDEIVRLQFEVVKEKAGRLNAERIAK